VRKRTAALLFLGLVLVLVAATLATLRTRWAGEKVCRAAAARVESATGLSLTFDACRLDLFGLSVEVDGMKLSKGLGPPAFAADSVTARLAAVQALGRQIHLEKLSLVRPRVQVVRPALPEAPKGATCPPAFLSRFEIRHLEVEQGELDVVVSDRRLRVEGIDVHSDPGRRSLRSLARPGRRDRLQVTTGPAHLQLAGRSFDAARTSLAAAIAADLSGAEVSRAEVELDGARLGLTGRIEDLCAPRLDLEVTAAGPVAAMAALAGERLDAEGLATVSMRVKGKPAQAALSGHLSTRALRVTRFTVGDVDADLHLEGDRVVVDRLVAAAQGGQLTVRGTVQLARGLPMTAEADLAGADLGEILDRLGVHGAWITMRLDGKGRVTGSLWPVQLSGQADVGVRDFKVLTRSYQEGAGDPGILAFDHARIESALRIDRQGLYFDAARAKIGRGLLRADAAVHFSRAGGFWVKVSGEADLDATGTIASIPWGGLATVEASVAASPYGWPHVEGRGRVADFRFLNVALGTGAAEIRFQKPTLSITAVEGTQASARYRGEVALDMLARPIRISSASFHARGRVRDLCEAVMDRIPRARVLRDALEAEADLSGSAQGPARSPDLDFEAQLGPGTLLGRRFDAGRVAGRLRALAEAHFAQAELHRGAGAVRGGGTWGLEPPFPLSLELAFSAWPASELDLLPGLSGTTGGSVTFSGPTARPRVSLAAKGSGIAVQGLELGDTRLELHVDGDQARLTAGAEGVDVSGEATLAGRIPFRAHAAVTLEDATRLAEGVAPAGLRVRAVGRLDADGDLLDWHDAHVDGVLAELQASYADLRIESTGPARLTATRGRWELAPLTLQGPNTALTVSGARLPGGELDGAASGGFDLRLLSGLVPTLRRAGGQLAVEARLSGSPAEPLVVGTGKLIDGSFQLKGASVSFTGVSGGMAFSQNKIIFDQLDAAVNGGKTRFKGEIELARLRPVHLRAEGVLDEVPLVIPGVLPATFSGRLEAEGTPESATLTGRLHVVRARYTTEVDLQSSLLKRKPPPPPRVYDRSGEWLRMDVQLAVDGDVRVDNDLVHGPVTGELTLTGTLAAPGVVGSLAMGRGSKVTFRGNDFVLTHAVLDFTDRNKLAMGLDVNGESQVRDYQVFLHVYGSMAEPHLKLTSMPDLPEQDIVTLLVLGTTRRDSGAQAGVSGVATATAAQALLSASGLDEQVRRFLPREGPVRDLSMRIVTGVSEETGQIEPRAEFESWLVRDKLRFRLQAPLGAGRGRQAQAELRLGEHTSVQYQWDNESLDVPTGDHGVDLKLRWEWTDER
jgi:translocation and assembly module TamB